MNFSAVVTDRCERLLWSTCFKVGKATNDYKVSRVVKIVSSVREVALLVPVNQIEQKR